MRIDIKRNGIIYIIEEDKNICKIGSTRQHPLDRMSGYGSYNHRELNLIYIAFVSDLINYEIRIQNLFRPYNIKGEWFKIDPEMIVNFNYQQFPEKFQNFIWEKFDKNNVDQLNKINDFAILSRRKPINNYVDLSVFDVLGCCN